MLGISIREPWASAVVDGHKPIENRRRGFPRHYRGLLLVQAALTWSTRGALDSRVLDAYGDVVVPGPPFGHGAVIGAVDLVDAHFEVAGCCQPWGESEYVEDEGTVRRGLLHLVLENPRRFAQPIPARGFVGLWVPDEDLRLEAELALAA